MSSDWDKTLCWYLILLGVIFWCEHQFCSFACLLSSSYSLALSHFGTPTWYRSWSFRSAPISFSSILLVLSFLSFSLLQLLNDDAPQARNACYLQVVFIVVILFCSPSSKVSDRKRPLRFTGGEFWSGLPDLIWFVFMLPLFFFVILLLISFMAFFSATFLHCLQASEPPST